MRYFLAFVAAFASCHALGQVPTRNNPFSGKPVAPGVIQFGPTVPGQLVPAGALSNGMTMTVAPGSAAGSSISVTQPTINMSGTSLTVSSPVRVSPHTGTVIDVQAREVVPPRTAGRLIGKAMRVLPILNTGFAIYDLIEELGGHITTDAAGKPVSIRTVNTGLVKYYWAQTCNVSMPIPATAQTFLTDADVCNNTIASDGYPMGTWQAQYGRCVLRSGGVLYGFCSGYKSTQKETDVATGDVETAVGDFLENKGLSNGSKAPQAVKDALTALPNEPLPSSSAPTVSGPSTTALPATTTVNTDGSRVVSTPTVAHTYSGDKVTSTVTTINTTYNSSNVVTNTSTTTAAAVPSTTQEDVCTLNPKALGCVDVGEAPKTDPLPKENKQVDFSPVSLATNATCPAPVAFTSFGRSYSVSYQPLCSGMATIKPLILALAALMALYIFVGGFKS